MKDDFQLVLVNIINLFKFNSVESIIKFILFIFLIAVASIVIHLACKFISLSIKKKEAENKNDHDTKQNTEYYEGYIQGVIDRKNNTISSALGSKKRDYLQGYLAGHKDDKFW